MRYTVKAIIRHLKRYPHALGTVPHAHGCPWCRMSLERAESPWSWCMSAVNGEGRFGRYRSVAVNKVRRRMLSVGWRV